MFEDDFNPVIVFQYIFVFHAVDVFFGLDGEALGVISEFGLLLSEGEVVSVENGRDNDVEPVKESLEPMVIVEYGIKVVLFHLSYPFFLS